MYYNPVSVTSILLKGHWFCLYVCVLILTLHPDCKPPLLFYQRE